MPIGSHQGDGKGVPRSLSGTYEGVGTSATPVSIGKLIAIGTVTGEIVLVNPKGE